MNTQDFKTKIKQIRKEALEIGFSIKTMDGYLFIWNQFIKWKNENHFVYNEIEYSQFLLEHYKFDVSKYTNKSKSHYQKLMRSKRILDDFDTYKHFMLKTALPNNLYKDYPSEWNVILDNYLNYCKNIKQNSNSSITVKQSYLCNLLSYFYQKGLISLKDFKKELIISFINDVVDKGNVSKRRNFYILREFLNYLFIENITLVDYSIYVPKIKRAQNKKIPTYFKQETIEELLESIPRKRKVDIRNYAIIIIAARLGLRISDILNIKLKDIDWQNNKINVLQPKTNNLNNLPLSKEIGWAIIDYIKKARPICDCEYLFVKMKYPFEKMEQFNDFNKYFEKVNFDFNNENKKGIHNLRHSLATNMLKNDIPIHIISSTLGHSSLETTNTYLKADIKKLKLCGLEMK